MNSHPYIVHFPIAFIVLSFIYEFLSLIRKDLLPKNIGLFIFIPGAISTILAALTGEAVFKSAIDICPEAERILYIHNQTANFTTWISIVLLLVWIFIILKKALNFQIKVLITAFLFLLSISVLTTGYLGGQLAHLYNI